MKTYITSGRISAVALVLMTAGFIAPHTASAQTREIRAAFTYYKSSPAEKIYADFQREALQACRDAGPRPIALQKIERACAADLLDKAVAKLGRADVAALHQGGLAQIAAR